MDILPCTFNRLIDCRAESMVYIIKNPTIIHRTGPAQSVCVPERTLSMNTLLNAGLITPIIANIRATNIINSIGIRLPLSLSFAKAYTLDCLPSATKAGVGVKSSAIPVKERSNSLMETVRLPFAGSLIIAFPCLKPQSTT